jgi:HTH-type transcriptional regulator / antitoxin HigA
MENIKVIKTEAEYNEALAAIESLMALNPDPESQDGEKLSLLVTLVSDYESIHFPKSLPDPVDAILFRMEQQNLKPQDLVPYLGSPSRVSEILSRKRPLSLPMIRALKEGLGIPASVLIAESKEEEDIRDTDAQRFPWKEMARRGYFGAVKATEENIQTLLDRFFASVGAELQPSMALLRKTNYARPTNKKSLYAWATRILQEANKIKLPKKFTDDTINADFVRCLVQLSAQERSPLLAQEFLRKNGILLIVEPHFPQTYLDGAALTGKNGPVIGITLRHDRLDSFWFTLMHEIGHVALHRHTQKDFFDEDLENKDRSANTYEREADAWARESLVPEQKWESSPAKLIPSPIAAESLARELGIHVAIVAGTMRYRGQKYQYLNSLVNQEKVRLFFPDKAWNK